MSTARASCKVSVFRQGESKVTFQMEKQNNKIGRRVTCLCLRGGRGAAVTKRPRLRGLQLQTFIFSPSWRLEVGGQGVGGSIFSRVVSPWLVDSPVFPVTTCGHPSVPACLFSIPITRNKDPPCERINLLTTLKAVSPNTVLA